MWVEAAKKMNIQWEPKVGPAAIIGVVGSLSVLVSIGVVWGVSVTKLDVAAEKADEARKAALSLQEDSIRRDQRIATQSERIGKIETAVTFMVPTLQRIESKIDSKP